MRESQIKGIAVGLTIRNAIANKTGMVRGIVTGLFPPKEPETNSLSADVAAIVARLENKQAAAAQEEGAIAQQVAKIAKAKA